ncbi:ribbon-helix-helix protein, CopG family [Fusobacterium animalis]|uniref:ribbon-helix-helix protein, CopG family n=1 Tax=Fusobacterium animalis TaxID=76859 RepID=UPI00355660FB
MKLIKKIGRPTNEPKSHRITVRIDEESKEILDEYCLKKEIKQAEAIRVGIKKLKDDLEK